MGEINKKDKSESGLKSVYRWVYGSDSEGATNNYKESVKNVVRSKTQDVIEHGVKLAFVALIGYTQRKLVQRAKAKKQKFGDYDFRQDSKTNWD